MYFYHSVNIGYKNNWSNILEKLNPKLMGWLKSKTL